MEQSRADSFRLDPSKPPSEAAPSPIYITLAGMSLLLGLAANWLLYQRELGINVAVLVLLTLIVAFGLMMAFQKPWQTLNSLFALPALAFALAVFWRNSPLLLTLNVATLTTCLFLFARFGAQRAFWGGHWALTGLAIVEAWMVEWIVAPVESLIGSQRWLRHLQADSQQAARWQAVLRGLFITVPMIIFFAALMASADAIFNDVLAEVFAWVSLDHLLPQLFITLLFAWLAVIGLKMLIVGAAGSQLDWQPKAEAWHFLGMIETGMLLGGLNLLFMVFVAIQARYFFGGADNITQASYTYADYARRGFFELLAIAVMVFGLLLLLSLVTRRAGQGERLFQALGLGLIVMTLVVMVSAFQRLSLYEEAYGYTRLRVVSHVFIVWLAGLFTLLALELTSKRPFLRYGWVVCALGYLLTLNAMNVDGFIAQHNLERYRETGKVDVTYLTTLSYDAVPGLVALLADPNLGQADRHLLQGRLGSWLYHLDMERQTNTLLDSQWSKRRAWQLLEARRADLAGYIRPTWQRSPYGDSTTNEAP
jgi:hypothetical protein